MNDVFEVIDAYSSFLAAQPFLPLKLFSEIKPCLSHLYEELCNQRRFLLQASVLLPVIVVLVPARLTEGVIVPFIQWLTIVLLSVVLLAVVWLTVLRLSERLLSWHLERDLFHVLNKIL